MWSNDSYYILTINSGSSSIKFSLYHMGKRENKILGGQIEKIGLPGSFFYAKDGNERILVEQHQDLTDHHAALKMLFEWLRDRQSGLDVHAVGHRVVHGGSHYSKPQIINRGLIAELRRLSTFAPEHLPRELSAIEAVNAFYPEAKQVACFDTAFHRNMPPLAQIYPLPLYLQEEGVLRYGFHGLSYEYIMAELMETAGLEEADGRIIIAHLGHGCSMTALTHRRSIDTTMGFTPAGGLIMSTRSGDLDPGVLLYLLEEKGMTSSQLNEIVNQRAGLLGVSGSSSNMKDLLEREKDDSRAALAIELYCYQAKKYLGALTAILGGLDTLVFTGGIGEKSPIIRSRICKGLEFMGIHLDSHKNDVNAEVISCDDASVIVRVIKTNEELVLARHTYSLLRKSFMEKKGEHHD